MKITFFRYQKLSMFVVLDIFVFIASFFMSYWLRYNGYIPATELKVFFKLCILFACIKVVMLSLFKIYSHIWEYIDLPGIINFSFALGIFSSVLYVFNGLYHVSPRSVIIIDFLLSCLFAFGYRYLLKMFLFHKKQLAEGPPALQKKVLIYGAGEAGSMVLKEIAKYPDLNLHVIGFLDDNREKWGFRINNKKVFGGLDLLQKSYQNFRFNELIIAMPSAAGTQIRKIIDECSKIKDIDIKIVPGTKQIIRGDVKWDNIRDVSLEDLLGREEIITNDKGIFKYISNKTILITGAGGSIGSELVRQCLHYTPKSILLLGKGENSIYQIEMEIRNNPRLNIKIFPFIVDVKDKSALEEIFKDHKVDIIFHAAAHKHVPLMEQNPKEAFKNNILGTWNLVDLAAKHRIKKIVLISTDKAVNPTSVMGATKRVAEILLQIHAKRNPHVQYTAVRFGNVLGSRGSVVPLFKKQIQEGGPVTVTHKDVVRYFMTIPEAVSLVMQSGASAKGGETFILDMGKPVSIYELAVNLIRLSGLKPHEDIKIKFTGLRPGEKLYEEILTDSEGIQATKNKKIFVAKPEIHDEAILDKIRKIHDRLPGMSSIQIKKEIFNLIKY